MATTPQAAITNACMQPNMSHRVFDITAPRQTTEEIVRFTLVGPHAGDRTRSQTHRPALAEPRTSLSLLLSGVNALSTPVFPVCCARLSIIHVSAQRCSQVGFSRHSACAAALPLCAGSPTLPSFHSLHSDRCGSAQSISQFAPPPGLAGTKAGTICRRK